MDSAAFLTSFRFRQDSNAPLYAQLSDFLRQRIQSGAWKPGDRMIPENDIVEIPKISRTTVRQAYEKLVEDGLIVRYRGKGTFVAEPRLKRSNHYLYSFTENIRASGADLADPSLRGLRRRQWGFSPAGARFCRREGIPDRAPAPRGRRTADRGAHLCSVLSLPRHRSGGLFPCLSLRHAARPVRSEHLPRRGDDRGRHSQKAHLRTARLSLRAARICHRALILSGQWLCVRAHDVLYARRQMRVQAGADGQLPHARTQRGL